MPFHDAEKCVSCKDLSMYIEVLLFVFSSLFSYLCNHYFNTDYILSLLGVKAIVGSKHYSFIAHLHQYVNIYTIVKHSLEILKQMFQNFKKILKKSLYVFI